MSIINSYQYDLQYKQLKSLHLLSSHNILQLFLMYFKFVFSATNNNYPMIPLTKQNTTQCKHFLLGQMIQV